MVDTSQDNPAAGEDKRSAKVDVSHYRNVQSLRSQLLRALWNAVWLFFFRPSPRRFHAWRRFLLRLFGAKVGKGSCVYPSCKIWAPWNLELDEFVCMSVNVDCYCVEKVKIGSHATVSQYSYLCTAGHDIASPSMALITAPITIGSQAWVCAGVFVGMGVNIGDGAVVAARGVVVKDVEPWTVVGGNPAKFIKKRQVATATYDDIDEGAGS